MKKFSFALISLLIVFPVIAKSNGVDLITKCNVFYKNDYKFYEYKFLEANIFVGDRYLMCHYANEKGEQKAETFISHPKFRYFAGSRYYWQGGSSWKTCKRPSTPEQCGTSIRKI